MYPQEKQAQAADARNPGGPVRAATEAAQGREPRQRGGSAGAAGAHPEAEVLLRVGRRQQSRAAAILAGELN